MLFREVLIITLPVCCFLFKLRIFGKGKGCFAYTLLFSAPQARNKSLSLCSARDGMTAWALSFCKAYLSNCHASPIGPTYLSFCYLLSVCSFCLSLSYLSVCYLCVCYFSAISVCRSVPHLSFSCVYLFDCYLFVCLSATLSAYFFVCLSVSPCFNLLQIFLISCKIIIKIYMLMIILTCLFWF